MKAVKVNPKVTVRVKVKADGQLGEPQRESRPSPRPVSGYNLSAGIK